MLYLSFYFVLFGFGLMLVDCYRFFERVVVGFVVVVAG
jgi:hypothetical protein